MRSFKRPKAEEFVVKFGMEDGMKVGRCKMVVVEFEAG